MTAIENNFVVIMAGGIGSRFWPMSTTSNPKQFHDVLGIGQTLLQMTADRYKTICKPENIIVVTNESYKTLVEEQLPFLGENQILLEPHRKNTAPCIAYACYKIYAQNPDASIIIAPSDHLILKQKEFEETIQIALENVKKSNFLMTIGIKPSRPDTGYGYIQFEEDNSLSTIKKVKTFTEKPTFDIAQRFIESGDFYWNSGMFIWNAKAIVDAFNTYLPEIGVLFQDGLSKYNTAEEANYIASIYPMSKNISIDYGIMEKADNVSVILADLGWSDLGTWGSLYAHADKDTEQNVVIGKKVMTYECRNNIVMVPSNKLVVLQGLSDYIVVENNNTLLICKMQDEQKIKQFVTDIKAKKDEQFI
jgi:mannose-1-phosphate guanylyltransferase